MDATSRTCEFTPVFGAGLGVFPRVGHILVTVDDVPWHWADASGSPPIWPKLPPGPHKVLVEHPNQQPLEGEPWRLSFQRAPRQSVEIRPGLCGDAFVGSVVSVGPPIGAGQRSVGSYPAMA